MTGFPIQNLLHKHKVEQTEVIYVVIHFHCSKITTTFGRISTLFWYTSKPVLQLCHEFTKYSSNHISKVYKATNQSVVKKNQNVFSGGCKQATCFIKLL